MKAMNTDATRITYLMGNITIKSEEIAGLNARRRHCCVRERWKIGRLCKREGRSTKGERVKPKLVPLGKTV